MTQGGAAFPVVASTDPPAAGPALRVAVVSDGRPVQAGPVQRVVVVTDGRPVQGNTPIPVVVATGAQAGQVLAGPPIPVVVVSGSLSSVPVNSVLPTISAAAQILSATTGTWSNSPSSYAYQWKRNGVDIGGATTSNYTITSADIGTTLTVAVTASNAAGAGSPATSAGYTLTYIQKLVALTPLAYYTCGEPSGATVTDSSGNGRNGTYVGSPTLGAAGIGDGGTAVTLNGSTQYGNVFSAGLAAAINGSEGTLACWFKVAAAGVWTDGASRQLVEIGNGTTNRLVLFKSNTANLLTAFYRAGSVTKSVNIGSSSTAWVHLAMTWSAAADQMIAYINGVQSGATQTALGVWGAVPTTALLGAFTAAPSNVWNGSLAHVVAYPTPLSAANILNLATVP